MPDKYLADREMTGDWRSVWSLSANSGFDFVSDFVLGASDFPMTAELPNRTCT